MRIDPSNYSVAELRDMLQRRDLIVNSEYQRGSGLWPPGPRSYFIDTILTGFTFPKLYFYEYLDRTTRKTKREIVDGQQRVTTITDFLANKFRLTSVSKDYAGMQFSDLEDDMQVKFLGYSVPVDVIRNAEASDILEMFRRMNAYTLPLNEAEKRHSSYQGKFKWFANRLTDQYASFFTEFGILTNRQIVRMADAELIAEIVVALEQGIISSSTKILNQLYKKYDAEFPLEAEYAEKIKECFDFIVDSLTDSKKTYLMRPYVVQSLCTALLHNRYGVPNVERVTGLAPTGRFYRDLEVAKRSLQTLALAHEANEAEGPYAQYVWSCSAGTNREPRRAVRVKFLLEALRGELLPQ